MCSIESLFSTALHREPNRPLILEALRSYPSAVATREDGEIVGFAYCGYMAPDMLELMNITVHANYRSSGIGTRMLRHVEKEVFQKYSAMMLTNSIAYEGDGRKRSASSFYLRNGYAVIASTGATTMYWKVRTFE